MPLIALISDIHSNIDALNAVAADIKSYKVEEIYCLGDVVGYGGAPVECVLFVMQNCTATVIGNHDEMGVTGVIFAPEHVAAPLRDAREKLTPTEKAWVKKLPLIQEVHGVTLVHSSLEWPEKWPYIQDERGVRAHFINQPTQICFVGHTHVPMIARYSYSSGVKIFTPNDKIINLKECALFVVNVGSVGQPRDDDPRASYGLFDTEKHLFQIRRVPYDIAKAQERIREARLPEKNAIRLESGS